MGVIVNLFDEIAVSNDLGTDILYSIENLIGSDGNDVFDGDHGANSLSGNDGNDAIRGHNGNDTILGGDDDDILWGDEGNDTVFGEDDDDKLRGGLGNDVLDGGRGDDHIRGEQGNDTIEGGAGSDTVFSWGEFDDFQIVELSPGVIQIVDTRPEGLEGLDTLTGVEFLEFFDKTVAVADLFAPAPVAFSDTTSTLSDRVISINAIANDQGNANYTWIASANVGSGMGAVAVIGGEVIYDPNGQFDELAVGQSALVTVTYTLETSGGQTTSGDVEVSVVGSERNGLPVFTSASIVSVVENQTIAMDVDAASATATEGAGLEYSLDPSGDVALFDIDPTIGVLTFKASPNFEVPKDIGVDNTYDVKVIASDTFSGTSATTDVFVTVTNINEAPVLATALADQSTTEEASVSFTLPANAFTDVDSTLTYTAKLASGAPLPIWLSFNAATLAFSGTPPLDFNGTIALKVIASDGTLQMSDTFNLVITTVDDPITQSTDRDGGTLTGGTANDIFAGSFGSDTFNGNDGDDIILDAGGDNIVNGGAGNDRIGLMSGNNMVSGGGDNDLIVGGYDNDVLAGDAGNDIIRGDVSLYISGSDRITGGTGDDLLEGGGSADTFVFNTGDGNDTIGALNIDYLTPANTTVSGADFVSGVDTIELNGFSLESQAAAFAKVTDVGGVATFADQGTTITFAGLTVADLTATDFALL
jgi:Ca2+-binding RTX toxin-like protein